ncbi:CRISPR-associated helicase Cas3' [Aliarcobacter butzleri]|uniref:CRISPR-associated helicase Cas3' n=1 Tax=Aliarcobacter butzleri TaxID=28197 RepID=UPI00244C3809|nr:CRISPR-associated helicase Cas3' [Aliarcobacter butzleri]MDH1975518.1 CRISPR-associated helicase Cas3' [Aliarcobacter butzleri]
MYIELNEQKYKDFFAHTCNSKPKEKLIDHCNLTKFYLEKVIEEKNLSNLIDNMIIDLDKDNFILIKKLFYNAIFLHDLGKTNESFQANKMDNELFEKTTLSSEHSIYSVKDFLNIFKSEVDNIEDDEKFDKINYILNTFSYSIAKHHGKLDSIEDYNIYEDGSYELVKKKTEKYINNPFEFYILNKLLFSLLVSSDYYATTHYMADLSTNDFGLIKDKQKILNKFENYEIVRNIHQNKDLVGINILRSKMFLEAEKNLLENLDKNIFYLEAPTGSGKTLTSINLAMKLIEQENINKIFYIFPFNTLVEQTKKQLEKIFDNELNIEVINSITPIKEKTDDEQENEESKYQKSYMSRLFFHNELILTTHISFFNILFGTTKEDNFPLWQMANSVIILDEIQSYDINLWSYMTKFLKYYAKALNMKIIIMSATLPKLDELIEDDNTIFEELIKNKDEYFQSDFLKNRVDIDFSLLEIKEIKNEELIEKLYEEKNKYSKIVFEFIKKDSAREFYNLLCEDDIFSEFEIYELSGDDNKATRGNVINKTNEKNIKIIIVATQVIEAGVDIDMDLGFKDISTLDSEEQFLGRINRSCLKLELKYKPKVYFFNKDDENKIYRNDHRIEDNLKKETLREKLLNKDFKSFYNEVFKKIKKDDNTIKSGILGNFDKFEEKVLKLNYKEIKEKMQLIKSDNFRLFFPFKFEIPKYEIEEFKNLDEIFLTDGKLDGQKVWDEFIALNEITNYAQKEIKRSELNSLMQFFTFNILRFNDKYQLPYYYNDEKFGFYFVKDYEEYITKDGKFDRKKYIGKKDEIFL